jgi:hypothetical protein
MRAWLLASPWPTIVGHSLLPLQLPTAAAAPPARNGRLLPQATASDIMIDPPCLQGLKLLLIQTFPPTDMMGSYPTPKPSAQPS